MLSNDKNVETIAQLIEIAKHYLGLQKEYLKFDIIDKLVRLLTAIALFIVFFLIVIAVVTYCSFGVAYWLSEYIGYVAAFFTIGFIHFLILLLFLSFHKPLIQKPLIRFLANLLMS